MRIPVPNSRRKTSGKFLRIYGAMLHNLKNVDAMIPLGMFTVVAVVSGSGKSTLVHDVLYKALLAKKNGGAEKEFCERLDGDERVSDMGIVDHSPIWPNTPSHPVIYLK